MTTEERKKGSERVSSKTGSKSKRVSVRRGAGAKSSVAKPKKRRKVGGGATKDEGGTQRQSAVKSMPPLRLQEKMNTESSQYLL